MSDDKQAPSQFFESVQGRNSIDHLLRTTRQLQMDFSAMADTKANIMITVSSIVLSIMLSQMDKPAFRLPALTLGGFSLISLLLAVIAVIPSYGYPKRRGGGVDKTSPLFNILILRPLLATGAR